MSVVKGDTAKDRQEHAKRAVDCFSKATYFFCSALWGYMVIKETNWLPWWMGGPQGGGFSNMFENAPFTPCPKPVLEYSLFTMGFHTGQFITHFEDMSRSDFHEMLLHHIATNGLYFGFIFSNLMPIGATIAFLHDIADIFGMLSKGLSSTRFDTATLIVFALMMVLWAMTRLVWLPILIYNIYTNPVFSFAPGLEHFQPYITLNGVFLSFLQFLHAFWFYLFLVMIYNKITKGKVEDIQNKVK